MNAANLLAHALALGKIGEKEIVGIDDLRRMLEANFGVTLHEERFRELYFYRFCVCENRGTPFDAVNLAAVIDSTVISPGISTARYLEIQQILVTRERALNG